MMTSTTSITGITGITGISSTSNSSISSWSCAGGAGINPKLNIYLYIYTVSYFKVTCNSSKQQHLVY